MNKQPIGRDKMTSTLVLKSQTIIFAFTILLILGITSNCKALDVTAKSCSQADVQSAASTVQNAGGGTVYIPAGNCTWDATVSVKGNVSFIGAGRDKTKLMLGSKNQFFDHQTINQFARYSGIGFYAPDGRSQGTAIAVYLREVENFRIDNCYFEGCWHGVISMKRVRKGLIDNNTFKRTNDYSSDYGIHWGQETTSLPELCEGKTGVAYTQCEGNWDIWWDDKSLHGGNYFEENWTPGTDNAIFVENNVFDWKGSAVESNWGTIQALVVRHNSFTNRDGNNGGFKPGVIFYEVYNNTFTNTLSPLPNNAALYLRGPGLVHNNTFTGYSTGGSLYVFREAYGYHYTDQVIMHDTYIWGNKFVNCKYSDDARQSWPIDSQGDNYLIELNRNYFFRAPQPGDRIYPYTPYTYPHPLSSGGPPPPPPPEEKPMPPKDFSIGIQK